MQDMHHGGMSDMTMPTTTSMDMGGGGMGGMNMFFHTKYMNEYVVFKGWKIQGIGGLVGSVVGVFALAFLYEAIKFIRQFLFEYASAGQISRLHEFESKNVLAKRISSYVSSTPFNGFHILQTVLHLVQTFLAYLLMLVFMTYDVWLCLGVIIGAGLGYFSFGWLTKIAVGMNVNDHCH